MKRTLLILSIACSTHSFAQWTNGGALFNAWGNGSSGFFNAFTYRSYGLGNFSFFNATPQARLHLSEHYLLSPWTGTNGDLFRTDGNNANSNNWRLFTGANANNQTEKFRITSLPNSNANELGSVQDGRLHLLTTDTRRVTVLGDLFSSYNRSGFVGLNDQTPSFHLDINTPNPTGSTYGELMLRARITDDPDAYISFLNLATTGQLLSPALMGRQSDNTAPALSTVGSIVNAQDLGANPEPVTRFFSTRAYDPTTGVLGLQRLNVVENRRIFGWYNAVDRLMTMRANGFLGVGTSDPNNRVEINSDFYAANGFPTGTVPGGPPVTDLTNNGQPGLGGGNATGFSGLRLTDLTAASTPYATNPGQGVLGLDSNGDVIYVPYSEGSAFVDCADQSPAADLTADSHVDLNNFNLFFENNDQVGKNLVAIGYSCPDPIVAKFNVYSDREEINSLFYTDDGVGINPTVNQFGVVSEIENLDSDFSAAVVGEVVQNNNTNRQEAVGVKGEVTQKNIKVPIGVKGISNDGGYGGWFQVYGNNKNTATNAVRAIANNSTTSNTAGYFVASGDNVSGGNVGVFVQSTGANASFGNYGVRSQAAGSNTDNYGVSGTASGGNNNYAIYGKAATIPNNYAGYFDGDVIRTGTDNFTSDANLKTNINAISNAMDIVEQLNPVSFEFDQTVHPHMNLAQGLNYGFIAQDVETILPELVSDNVHPAEYDSLGNLIYPSVVYKSLNYQAFISILAKGMKEQQVEIEERDSIINNLNSRLSDLENCLSGILPLLCQMNNSAIQQTDTEVQQQLLHTIDVHLSDRNNIVLNQNVPNPFAEKTVISFSIPEGVKKAQIHFYDGVGKLINTVDINQRGEGQINVFANDLSTGVYTYSLVADDNIVVSKRMMKE